MTEQIQLCTCHSKYYSVREEDCAKNKTYKSIPNLRYLRAPPDADSEEGERDEYDGALHGAVLHQVRDLAHDHRAGVVLRARGGFPLLMLKNIRYKSK